VYIILLESGTTVVQALALYLQCRLAITQCCC
jgi:hypothetical protein